MTVSQGYEAFETFLIDTLACHLFSNQRSEAFAKGKQDMQLSLSAVVLTRCCETSTARERLMELASETF